MQHYPKTLRNLIRQLAKLPGVGEKTAERLALHLLNSPSGQAEALAEAIVQVRTTVRRCRQCRSLSDQELCPICADPSRDAGLLCVVEQPADMVSIEKAGCYNGLFHILGGVLAPLDGVGPEQLRLDRLWQRVRQTGVREVILATGTGVEGEATAAYIAEQLGRLGVKVSRIASGVPMGGEIQYVDPATLKRAMEGRHGIG